MKHGDIYLYMMKGFKKRQIKGEAALMDVAGSDWNFTTQNLVNRDKKRGGNVNI